MKGKDESLRLAFAVIIFGIGMTIGFFLSRTEPTVELRTVSPFYIVSVETQLTAVDSTGSGLVIPLLVEAKPGEGRILTNIDRLVFWTDTQQSIQTAREVAGDVTKINVSRYDLIYTLDSGNYSTIVGGPSAGAALTVATIAVLRNQTLRNDVMITGTINEDGTIGPVGGIFEKARAAREAGASIFLVPVGESTQTFLKPEKKCSQNSGFNVCSTKYKTITTNIGEDVGINVQEVYTIREALPYFTT